MGRTTVLESRLPIAAAPMAGGPTTVALVRAVARAGCFPFLAGGYRATEELAADLDGLGDLGVPLGVNLFVPGAGDVDTVAFRDYAERLRPDAERYGIDLTRVEPARDDDRWGEKLALLLERPVPVVSLTFGLPPARDVTALRRRGTAVLATVTTPAEARAAQELGVDALVVQGSGAGGHSAGFDPQAPPHEQPTDALVSSVRSAVGLPVVATGGVDGPAAVTALLAAGAESVAAGTLFLRTQESGASLTHREALGDPQFTGTVVTRAFTGRYARGLRNAFVDRHDAHAPIGYPAVHHLTRPIRQAAARAGDPHRLHLWAGTGYRQATTGRAEDVVRRLERGL